MFNVQKIEPIHDAYSKIAQIEFNTNNSAEQSITMDAHVGLVVKHIGVALFASVGVNLNAITPENKDRDNIKIYITRGTGDALMSEAMDIFEFAKRFANDASSSDKLFIVPGGTMKVQIVHTANGLTVNNTTGYRAEISFNGYKTDKRSYNEYLAHCASLAKQVSQSMK